MSVQNPNIPTPTQAKGIDVAIYDMQARLDTSLTWLTNGMGRAYRLSKVEVNRAAIFLPEVRLNDGKFGYFAATPDNDKQGQNIFIVGDASFPDFQNNFYGIMSYPVSIIFSANLETIDSALLATEDFTEHLIQDVRDALIRDPRGKVYRMVSIDSIQREFEDVYAEFDVSNDRGIAHNPMTHFRLNITIQLREDCADSSLDRCAAILANLSQDELLNCILPTYDFSDSATQAATTPTQQADIINWLCGTPPPTGQFSFLFDGINESIYSNQKPELLYQGDQDCTMSAWIKLTAYDAAYSPVMSWFYEPSQRGWNFYIDTTGVIVLSFLEGSPQAGRWGFVAGTTVIPLNTWVHVAATKDGQFAWTNAKVYLNGVDDTATTFGSMTNNMTGPMMLTNPRIGATGSTGAKYFQGNIFAPRIWNRELTPAEITTESTNKTYETTSPANIIWDADFDLAMYGVFDWTMPNKLATTGGSQSQNMEITDKVTDIP